MVVYEGLNFILDPVFSPLLRLGTASALLIITIILAFLMTVIYKYTTNQSLMKDLKDELKTFQKQMKELRSNPGEMMKVQKKAMETNMKYMMHSFRSTIFTFIPIILIFSWLHGNLAYLPIMPGEQFTTTMHFNDGVFGNVELGIPDGLQLLSEKSLQIEDNSAVWILKGDEGKYTLDYTLGEKIYSKEVLITTEQAYEIPDKLIKKDPNVSTISINNEKLKVFLGMGWFWTYIIFSIVFSMIFRKLFKVY
ncbi:MAG: EMC3/TMCO1 family protein [Nanoarchaeota archaeon]|nr:EMC3/TMCO1 family protein [Nanoarchaeota archaeon]